MSSKLLSADAICAALSLRDLSDEAAGPHAMQQIVNDLITSLQAAWQCAVRVARRPPIVDVSDNYDALHYSREAVARDVRYTRYLSEQVVLRTHTTAMIPGELRALAASERPEDVLIACPGICYRRDCIDRLHTGEPHQLDLWRIRSGELGEGDLEQMIALVVAAALPGARWRTSPAVHPYTLHGRQIDVEHAGSWVEIGECGVALPELLGEQGLDPAHASGLAMGVGLDRLLMLRKGIDDIRLLRSSDPRVASQMLDLSPYRAVSRQPAVVRDLSLAVPADRPAEELGDRVRSALGADAAHVESVAIVSETPYAALPDAAIERMGMSPEHKNVLVRIVLRRLDRALTHTEANGLRNAIYSALHTGSRGEWA